MVAGRQERAVLAERAAVRRSQVYPRVREGKADTGRSISSHGGLAGFSRSGLGGLVGAAEPRESGFRRESLGRRWIRRV